MKIKIDTSKVTGVVEGGAFLNKNFYDIWHYKDVEFESGKIYGLVSEYGQGCMYLSYLLGGRVDFDELQVFIDDNRVTETDLMALSWNLEPAKEKYKNKTVKKSIEQAIKKNGCKDSFEDIAKEFKAFVKAEVLMTCTYVKKRMLKVKLIDIFHHSVYTMYILNARRFLYASTSKRMGKQSRNQITKRSIEKCRNYIG